ncbi:MAG: hydrogenase maturation protease [Candidatus Methylomirabilales bacterium]
MQVGGRLVIGYGSDLRGDDAAGRLAAGAVAAWGLPGVRVLSVHQLTPDLAGPVAEAAMVVFLDAHAAAGCPRPRIRRLAPALRGPHLGHHGGPRAILAWAALAGGRAPAAYWATIPAQTFALGAELSPRTRGAIRAMLPAIRRLLDRPVGVPGTRAQGDSRPEASHPPRPSILYP